MICFEIIGVCAGKGGKVSRFYVTSETCLDLLKRFVDTFDPDWITFGGAGTDLCDYFRPEPTGSSNDITTEEYV